MENKVYNDDVERVVNESARAQMFDGFYEKREAKTQRKLLQTAIIYFLYAAAFFVGGSYGLIVDWLYVPVSMVFGAYACFSFGRFFENGKCMGWK